MTRRMLFFEILLIAAACIATVIAYPHLPERMAMHWNAHLRADSYGPKWEFFLVGPGLMAAITLLTCAGPWLSPKNFNVDSFRSTWQQIMLLVFCMTGYIYAARLWAAFDPRINAGRLILGGVCLVIVLMGNLLGKVRKNFIIGIRTPWTLASDRVWNATHRFAARIWIVGGLLGLLFTIFGLRIVSIAVLILCGLIPYMYSLVIYKQMERHKEI